jgi:hypothetical protein
MPDVSAWRKYVLFRGVVLDTPAKMTNQRSTRLPASRMRAARLRLGPVVGIELALGFLFSWRCWREEQEG